MKIVTMLLLGIVTGSAFLSAWKAFPDMVGVVYSILVGLCGIATAVFLTVKQRW